MRNQEVEETGTLQSNTPVMTSKVLARGFMSAVLRREEVRWPATTDSDFCDVFLEEAENNGADLMVTHILRGTEAWETIPDLVQEALVNRLRSYAAVDMARKADLVQLLEQLDRSRIPVLLLKGGALSYTHYPDACLRPRCDTDIFIDVGDIRKIQGIMIGCGYRLFGRIFKSHQFNFVNPDFGGGISNYDVHWRSNNRSRYARVIGHSEAWQESVPVPGLGTARTLKPVHALLLACMHRAGNPNHDPERLIWLYDIHLLVAGMSDSELIELSERAVSENIQEICLDGMAKAQSEFGTVIPGQVRKKLSAPARADSIGRRFSDSPLALILADIRELPGWKCKIELVREYLLPPGDYLLNRYNKTRWYWGSCSLPQVHPGRTF